MTELILIRHAHRDLSSPDADNGLSAKGRKQKRRLAIQVKTMLGRKERVTLLSSPRRRCIETAEPLRRYFRQEIALSDLLLEEQSGESREAFQKRVERALVKFQKLDGKVVLFSHGDWLSVALERLCGAQAEIKKGGIAEVEGRKLVRLLQPNDL